MFDLIATVLEFFYSIVPDYGLTIVMLTIAVRVLLTPLTVRGTKSMLKMREVQPQVRKLQAAFKQHNDRMQLNQELSELYRKNNINPLGGCFPLIAQIPVFFVLYQVIQGLTRRASEIGYALGISSGNEGVAPASLEPIESARFNPDWLDPGDSMYEDLIQENEMLSWGLDLASSPWSILTDDIVRGLPYLGLILVTGILSYFQQRQISGRSSDDPNPQQRILMRIIPIFIPIISFGLATALVVYFLTTSAIGVLQQAFLTRRVYSKNASDSNGVIDTVAEETETSTGTSTEDARPQGLLERFSGSQQPSRQHGKSPVSRSPKKIPPKAKQTNSHGKSPVSRSPKKIPPKAKSLKPEAPKSKKKGTNNTKDSQQQSKEVQPSKRVTPKKRPEENNPRRRR